MCVCVCVCMCVYKRRYKHTCSTLAKLGHGLRHTQPYTAHNGQIKIKQNQKHTGYRTATAQKAAHISIALTENVQSGAGYHSNPPSTLRLNRHFGKTRPQVRKIAAKRPTATISAQIWKRNHVATPDWTRTEEHARCMQTMTCDGADENRS